MGGGTNLRGRGERGITLMGNPGTLASASTVYLGPYGGAVQDATEADQTVAAPHSGRLKLIRQVVNTNSLSTGITISLRIGGVTQSGGSVVPASTDGTFDSTEVVEFAKGDEINLIVVIAGSGSAAWHFMAEFEWDND